MSSTPSKPATFTAPDPMSILSSPLHFSTLTPPEPPSISNLPSTLRTSPEPAIECTDSLRPRGTRMTRSAHASVPEPPPLISMRLELQPPRPLPQVPFGCTDVVVLDQRPSGGYTMRFVG